MTSCKRTGRPSPCGTWRQPSQTFGMAPTPCSPQPWQSIGGQRELSPIGRVNCRPWGAEPYYTTKPPRHRHWL